MEITLALGGGGVRGAAHIGVLNGLEKAGYRVRAIAGTSAGGIAGAVYAAGYSPEELLAEFAQLDQTNLYARRPGDGPSILGVAGINRLLKRILGERTFEELQIPLAVTALDIKSKKEVVLNRGRVVDAVLATMSMPGVFPPQEYADYLLVDGGLVDPVPVAAARAFFPRLPVVAVALDDPTYIQEITYSPPNFLMPSPLLRTIARLRVAQAFSIFLESMDISSGFLTEFRLELDQPDVIIRPHVGDLELLENINVVDIALRGEQALEKALPTLERAANWQRRFQRWFRYRR
ncbi:MAG: patatin-like phospholipase family protein [Anaerolineales bacterium]|jgi:NTE family protein